MTPIPPRVVALVYAIMSEKVRPTREGVDWPGTAMGGYAAGSKKLPTGAPPAAARRPPGPLSAAASAASKSERGSAPPCRINKLNDLHSDAPQIEEMGAVVMLTMVPFAPTQFTLHGTEFNVTLKAAAADTGAAGSKRSKACCLLDSESDSGSGAPSLALDCSGRSMERRGLRRELASGEEPNKGESHEKGRGPGGDAVPFASGACRPFGGGTTKRKGRPAPPPLTTVNAPAVALLSSTIAVRSGWLAGKADSSTGNCDCAG